MQDQGIGISNEDQQRLFTPFFRSNEPLNRLINSDSHGMGLSICHKIAQCLNGSISVHSSVGSGTIMTLMLNLQADEVEDFQEVIGAVKKIQRRPKNQKCHAMVKRAQINELDHITEEDSSEKCCTNSNPLTEKEFNPNDSILRQFAEEEPGFELQEQVESAVVF